MYSVFPSQTEAWGKVRERRSSPFEKYWSRPWRWRGVDDSMCDCEMVETTTGDRLENRKQTSNKIDELGRLESGSVNGQCRPKQSSTWTRVHPFTPSLRRVRESEFTLCLERSTKLSGEKRWRAFGCKLWRGRDGRGARAGGPLAPRRPRARSNLAWWWQELGLCWWVSGRFAPSLVSRCRNKRLSSIALLHLLSPPPPPLPPCSLSHMYVAHTRPNTSSCYQNPMAVIRSQILISSVALNVSSPES